MTFLIQQTLIYAVPLMIVALAGVFAERSGIINLALEGIMVFGAFIGVWFVRILQTSDAILSLKQSGNWVALQGVELLTMLVAAAFGALFSLLLSFASINLRADQTIGGTALNLMAPALVLFFIRIIANQNTLQMLTGDAASWFMIKKSTLGIDKNTDLGFSARRSSTRSTLRPTSASCFSSSCRSCSIRRASACACVPAAKIPRRRIRWASTSTRCATRARPFPARSRAWAASSMR